MIGDKEYMAYVDGKFTTIPPIDTLCRALKDKFERQEKANEILRKENEELKSGVFEKEYIASLKNDYEKMKRAYNRGFPISESECEKLRKWQNKYINKDTKIGTIGGMFTYEFTPTSIGVSGVCIAPNGDRFEFQEIG